MRFKYSKQIESHLAPEVCRTQIVKAGQLQSGFNFLFRGISKLPQGKNYFVLDSAMDLYVYGQGVDARSRVTVRIQKQGHGSRVVLSSSTNLVWLIFGISSLACFGIEGFSLLVAAFFSMGSRDVRIFWCFMLLGSAFMCIVAFVGHRRDCGYMDRINGIFERLLAGKS